MRARGEPTVSTPMRWDEVEGADGSPSCVSSQPTYSTGSSELGDLFAPVLTAEQELPTRLGG